MTRIKTPNQKKSYDSLNKRLNRYATATDTLLKGYNSRIAVLVGSSQAKATEHKPFSFLSSERKNQLNSIINEAQLAVYGLILADTKTEWGNSNKAQDKLIGTSVKRFVGEEKAEEYYQDNEDELKEFQERSDDGTTVYGRVGNHMEKYKSCLEAAISMALLSGATLGAAYLLSRINHYLSNFGELYEKYTKQYGEKKNLQDAMYFIKRLVKSEANMAYRRAELLRWNQWSFILGYKICLSPGHDKDDICDDLKGIYPKTFIWTGWHPNDRCYCVPILQSKESLAKGETEEPITEYPETFQLYLDDTAARVSNGYTIPYWAQHNIDIKTKMLGKKRSAVIDKRKERLLNNSEPIVLTDEQKKNIEQIAKKYGFPVVRPMSHKKADSGSVNTGSGVKYSENCQSCVVVYEARLRGLDIATKEFIKGGVSDFLGSDTSLAWRTTEGKHPKRKYLYADRTKDMIADFETLTQNGGRYHIGINYENDKQGHVLCAKRIDRGEIILYDPQRNGIVELSEYKDIVYIEILKVDELLFDSDILGSIARKSYHR